MDEDRPDGDLDRRDPARNDALRAGRSPTGRRLARDRDVPRARRDAGLDEHDRRADLRERGLRGADDRPSRARRVGRPVRHRRPGGDPGCARSLQLARRASRDRQGAHRRLGISLGGGIVWGALRAGIPFAAAEVNETWVDLNQALAPNSITKSGAIFQFLNSVPSDRTAPALLAVRGDALANRNLGALKAYADARSVRSDLPKLTTPTLVFQGRRDFAFGLEQGIEAYKSLAGPKRLYIGDFGHAPSTFPGPDSAVVFTEAADWFGRYLKNDLNGIDTRQPVELAPDPFREAQNVSYASLPPTTSVKTKIVKVNKTFGSRGKVVVTLALPKQKLEVFGAPVLSVAATTKTSATQLVAVVEAIGPKGDATIVSEGGTALATGRKAWNVSFPVIYDTALIARGSKLRVTLSWTTTAQNGANLLYLTGVPDGSSLTIKTLRVSLPVLKNPISG